jgi:hypothetical protein
MTAVDLFLCLPSITAALTDPALGAVLTLRASERFLQGILCLLFARTGWDIFAGRQAAAQGGRLTSCRNTA